MAKFTHHEQCPRCAARGADRRGNNLGVWADGSKYCFSCGFYVPATFRALALLGQRLTLEDKADDKEKAVLPSDWQREIPTDGWKWLLQYGIPMSYWQTRCGYSPKENRVVFNVGSPTRFSVGRALSLGASKWKVYGDKSSYVEVVNEQVSTEVVLVEDFISAHKVALSGYTAIPLFGTAIHDNVIKRLQGLKRPVVLWLDGDQYENLPRKIGRLQAFLGVGVRHIQTRKDPKEYSVNEVKEILK